MAVGKKSKCVWGVDCGVLPRALGVAVEVNGEAEGEGEGEGELDVDVDWWRREGVEGRMRCAHKRHGDCCAACRDAVNVAGARSTEATGRNDRMAILLVRILSCRYKIVSLFCVSAELQMSEAKNSAGESRSLRHQPALSLCVLHPCTF